ncbi:MAG: outer membrane beta-barrel protein [Nitrospirota bacterium]
MRHLPAFALVLALSTSFIVINDAHALEFGRIELHPYLQFGTDYDDNVFATNGDRVGDWFFVVTPGLTLKLPQRDNYFEFDYHSDIYRYISKTVALAPIPPATTTTGNVASLNDTEDHFVRGLANINFPGGLAIKAEDDGSIAHLARTAENQSIEGTSLTRYYSNLVNAEISYKFGEKFKLAANYQGFVIDYTTLTGTVPATSTTNIKFMDRRDNGAGLTGYYQFIPNFSALVQGIYKNVYHNNDNSAGAPLNSNEYWAMTGLTWDITSKSTGTIKAGYEWKDFEFPGTKDFRSPAFQITINHNFTPKTSIELTGLRQAYETDDPAVDYYTTTRGTVSVSFKPFTKILIRPYGSYEYNSYPAPDPGYTESRKDNYWQSGIALTYDMNKWFSVGVEYTHTKRESNISINDYTDNLAMVKLKGTI